MKFRVIHPTSAALLRKLVGRDGEVIRDDDGVLAIHTTSYGKSHAAWRMQMAIRGIQLERPQIRAPNPYGDFLYKRQEQTDVDLNEKSPAGWHGTVRAMKTHHPEKFGKGKGKINAYALAWSEKESGDTAHYKDQKTSKKGEPVKKKRFKEWLEERKFISLGR